MPISQQRMINILNAAQAFADSFTQLRTAVLATTNFDEQAKQRIYELALELSLDPKQEILIALELHHFAKNAKKNEKAKLTSQKKRQGTAIDHENSQ